MTITLNGTTGITNDGGYTGDGISFADNAPSNSLVVNSSGNVGIGVTPTTASRTTFQVGSYGAIDNNGGTGIEVSANAAYNSGWKYINTAAASVYAQSYGQHAWYTAPSGTAGNAISFTQAMTLDTSGNLLVGTTSSSFNSSPGFKFGVSATTPAFGTVGNSSSNGDITYRLYSTGAGAYRFYVGYGGTVYATNTAISSLSDQRFKENIRNLDVGLDAVMALKPRVFDWKEGKGADVKDARGFIAQEFEQVFPDLIDEWQDPAPEGEEPYKSVRQDLIPVLVKAIQELKAELDATKAEVDALKGVK